MSIKQVKYLGPAGADGVKELIGVAIADPATGDAYTALPITPGTGATSLGKAEDAAHASGDVGVGMLGVINTAAANSAANGDYAFLSLSFSGAALVAPHTNPVTGDGTAFAPVGWVDQGNNSRLLAVQQMLFNGATRDFARTPNVFKVVALSAATAEATIWTPATGKKFRLMGFLLTCGAASTLTFKDNTGGTAIFAARGATDTPISPASLGNGILSGAADRVLTVTRGTSATLDGVVWGTEE